MKSEETAELPDSINHVRQSSHIETFGNTNGVVYLCCDDGTEFSRKGVFDIYGKNYLVTFLITLYQQFKLQQLIDEAGNLIVTTVYADVKGLKSKMLTYMAQTDFTQISHNPGRNLLYKFFRRNFEIKELLEEVSTIIKKIDQDTEAENARHHTEKAHKLEKTAFLIELLILPYYLHHIIELFLVYARQDEEIMHEWAFWGTIAVTGLVICFTHWFLKGGKKEG